LFLACGAGYGLFGVVFGAFGAHALRGRLEPDLLAAYHTGVQYQFYHALALIAVGLLGTLRPVPLWWTVSGCCFAVGVLLFSGSLYVLALSGLRLAGIVTPFGGLLFLAGWASLLWGVLRNDI
jgi:uncharacterized membrane protein YgdD (TMEM256/DUF423 family)